MVICNNIAVTYRTLNLARSRNNVMKISPRIDRQYRATINALVRVMLRVNVTISANMVTVRMGTKNSACHVYLSVPDGK